MEGRERGAALLAVLLLVAVMAAMTVAAFDKLKLATALARNSQSLDQARAYAIGAEALAIARIGQMTNGAANRTTLAGNWNGTTSTIPLPDGVIAITARDGGNCFNLNSVAEGSGTTGLTARAAGVIQFQALMRLLDIDAADAATVAAALADWIDADDIPQPGGAEDGSYAERPVPHRVGNTLLADVSELRAVGGVTPEIYARLRPFVCVLPSTELSPINVNTLLPDQAPLVAMLLAGRMTVEQARQVLAERPENGWAAASDFWKVSTLAALIPTMEVQQQVGIRTRWFAVRLDVDVAGAQVSETALIDGALMPARLVARQWGSDE
jgi:general secretion pathway protein K